MEEFRKRNKIDQKIIIKDRNEKMKDGLPGRGGV
jgi:hypothetical protein